MSEKQEQTEKSAAENLIHLTNKSSKVSTSDLNSRLQEIERELRHLNAREAATNKHFRELLSESRKQSSEQNMQLEDTREQINESRQNYRKLSQDYQRLAAGANLLSVTLEQARADISNDLESLQLSTRERTDQLADGQLQLIERANRIEQKSSQMAEDLDARVNVIHTTISALESKIESQLREFAEQSEQRYQALDIRTNMLAEELNKADAKLSERTDALQAGQTKLADQNEDLQFQTNILDTRTSDLEERTDAMEDFGLKSASKLSRLDDSVDRQHKGFAIAAVLIVVTLGILSIVQQNRWLESNHNDIAHEQAMVTQSTTVQQNSSRITVLENQSQPSQAQPSVSDEQVTAALKEIKQSISKLQAKTENTDNRMTAMAPHRSFGLDNTIHNAQWLAQQDKNQYVIEVATTDNKQDLYDIATRWSTLLNRSNLAYIEKQSAGKTVYTLVYGTFADQSQAEQVSRSLPIVSFNSRPVTRKLAEL